MDSQLDVLYHDSIRKWKSRGFFPLLIEAFFRHEKMARKQIRFLLLLFVFTFVANIVTPEMHDKVAEFMCSAEDLTFGTYPAPGVYDDCRTSIVRADR